MSKKKVTNHRSARDLEDAQRQFKDIDASLDELILRFDEKTFSDNLADMERIARGLGDEEKSIFSSYKVIFYILCNNYEKAEDAYQNIPHESKSVIENLIPRLYKAGAHERCYYFFEKIINDHLKNHPPALIALEALVHSNYDKLKFKEVIDSFAAFSRCQTHPELKQAQKDQIEDFINLFSLRAAKCYLEVYNKTLSPDLLDQAKKYLLNSQKNSKQDEEKAEATRLLATINSKIDTESKHFDTGLEEISYLHKAYDLWAEHKKKFSSPELVEEFMRYIELARKQKLGNQEHADNILFLLASYHNSCEDFVSLIEVCKPVTHAHFQNDPEKKFQIFLLKGMAYYYTGMYKDAAASLINAIYIADKHSFSHTKAEVYSSVKFIYCEALFELYRHTSEIKYINNCIKTAETLIGKLPADDPSLFKLLCSAYAFVSDFDKASDAARKLLKINRKDVRTYGTLIISLCEIKGPNNKAELDALLAEAKNVFVDDNNKTMDFLLFLRDFYGNDPEIEQKCAEIIRKYPKEGEYHLYNFYILTAQEKYFEAFEAFVEAYKLNQFMCLPYIGYNNEIIELLNDIISGNSSYDKIRVDFSEGRSVQYRSDKENLASDGSGGIREEKENKTDSVLSFKEEPAGEPESLSDHHSDRSDELTPEEEEKEQNLAPAPSVSSKNEEVKEPAKPKTTVSASNESFWQNKVKNQSQKQIITPEKIKAFCTNLAKKGAPSHLTVPPSRLAVWQIGDQKITQHSEHVYKISGRENMYLYFNPDDRCFKGANAMHMERYHKLAKDPSITIVGERNESGIRIYGHNECALKIVSHDRTGIGNARIFGHIELATANDSVATLLVFDEYRGKAHIRT